MTEDSPTPGDEEPITPEGNQPAVIASDAEQIKVNAGAGTGKTSTMIWRIERMIEQRGVPPDRLLVLTFANKAAHSIREDLVEQLDGERGYDVDAYTYHSFCHRLLSEYAYPAGLAPEFELVTEDRRRAIVQRIATGRDYRFVEPTLPGSGGDVEQLVDDLDSFVRTAKHDGQTPAELRKQCPSAESVARLRSVVSAIKREAAERFDPDRHENLEWSPENFRAEQFQQFEELLAAQRDRLVTANPVEREVASYLDDLTEMPVDLAGTLDRTADDGLSFLPYTLFTGDVHGVFKDTEQTPIDRLEAYVELWEYAYDFVDGYRAYEQRLDAEGALDYDDLISQSAELLGSDLGGEILDQWDCVYCDEFQDTDRGQMELLRALASEMEVLVIGDTDQAIYEWRGAHPENLDEFEKREPFRAAESIDLSRNYRSLQGVLDLANELPGSTTDLDASRDGGEETVVRVEGEEDTDQQAQQVATAVSKTITGSFDGIDAGRDLAEESLAVLVRRNDQAVAVAEQLDERGIPYELAGGPEGTSPGIETVFAYLRVLVDPGNERSLNRVLQMLYRVTGEDIRTLNRGAGPLLEALHSVPDAELRQPERVARAAGDIETLRAARKTHAVSELYERFKNTTKIHWYLTEAERDALGRIEAIVEQFDDDPIETGLTESFVQYLERQESASGAAGDERGDVAEKVEGKVNVMTVHKAKGLEFDVVYLPYLSADWPVYPGLTTSYGRGEAGRGVFDTLTAVLADGSVDPLYADRSGRQVREAWRVLHVAITRSRDRVFLFGHDPETARIGSERVQQFLPDSIQWDVGGPEFPLWDAVTGACERLDDSQTADVTGEIDRDSGATRGTLRWYDGTTVAVERALSEVRDLARKLRNRELDGVDPATVGFHNEPLGTDPDRSLSREHSHTALEAYRECPRRHYLDHVVGGFDDPIDATHAGAVEGFVPQRDVGTLFHEVAEAAFWHRYTTEAEWHEATRRLGQRLDLDHAIRPAADCVSRYFETSLPATQRLAAEVPFELAAYSDDAPATVRGYVDALYELETGETVVLDYKTTRERNSIQEASQLLVYLAATRRTERLPDVERAGYAYVGQAGPHVELFGAGELRQLGAEVEAIIRSADDSTYGTAPPKQGSHCRDCAHRSLGCGPAEYALEPDWTGTDG